MLSNLELYKEEYKYLNPRILAFWGIYFTFNLILIVVWGKSFNSRKRMVVSILYSGLKNNAIVYILQTPPYITFFAFLSTIIAPSIILILLDLIPNEIASGQMSVLKSSATPLDLIYGIRIRILSFSFLVPHLLLWGIIHIITIYELSLQESIFTETLVRSFLQYIFFSFMFWVFINFAITLILTITIVTENQTMSSFIGIFVFIAIEILQAISNSFDTDITFSFSSALTNLFYQLHPNSEFPLISNDMLIIVTLCISSFFLHLFFQHLLRSKDIF